MEWMEQWQSQTIRADGARIAESVPGRDNAVDGETMGLFKTLFPRVLPADTSDSPLPLH